MNSKGEIYTDLIVHLFKGYTQANNDKFVRYIKDQETEWQKGVVQMTWEDIMELAKEKFKLMKSKGRWQDFRNRQTSFPSPDPSQVNGAQPAQYL